MVQEVRDVIVVGGGLVGLALSWVFLQAGYSVALVEARPPHLNAGSPDRFLVLTEPNIRLLQHLGLWTIPEISYIRDLEISQEGSFGRCHLHAPTSLGGVVSHQALHRSFWDIVTQHQKLTLIAPGQVTHLEQQCDSIVLHVESSEKSTFSAQVVFAAEGGHSSLKTFLNAEAEVYDYRQTALVSWLWGDMKTTHHTAYERFLKKSKFRAGGVLAVLPWKQQQHGIIWVDETSRMESLLALEESDWTQTVQHAFGYRAGIFKSSGAERSSFPLRSQHLKQMVHGRVVFVGNAAHQLHPMAAQGFNLSLRDINFLQEHLKQSCSLEPQVWMDYASKRKADQQQTHRWTHTLATSLHHDSVFLRAARSCVLTGLNQSRGMQKMLMNWGMGLLRF